MLFRLTLQSLLVFGLTCVSEARTPRGRQLTGTIQQLDLESRHAVFQPLGTDPVKFVWVKYTDFIACGSFVDSSHLSKGDHVKIVLHRPFFGDPFVTKVVFLDCPKAHTVGK